MLIYGKPTFEMRDFRNTNMAFNDPSFVYRLLRDNERPERGIKAKCSNSNQSVWGHVRFGSKGKSHFISCSKTYPGLRRLIEHKQGFNIRVVKIDVNIAKANNPSLEIIDLTNFAVRRDHIKCHVANGMAVKFEEVLFVGEIHASAVTVIYDGPKDECPHYAY